MEEKKRKEYFLIGHSASTIICRKPPTLRMLLKNLIFENLEKKVNLEECVKSVIKKAGDLWKYFGVETSRNDHLEQKLKTIYLNWRQLYYKRRENTAPQQRKRSALLAKLDQSFGLKRTFIKKIGKIEDDESDASDSMEIDPNDSLEMEQFDSLQNAENVMPSTSQSQMQLFSDDDQGNFIRNIKTKYLAHVLTIIDLIYSIIRRFRQIGY